MSEFEIKYIKEVIENLKLIRESIYFKYKIDDIIEDLESLLNE